jgi:cell division protein ZapA (FtsZ GTPase activity inhibitor)
MTLEENTAAAVPPQHVTLPGSTPDQPASGPEVAGLLDQAYTELRQHAPVDSDELELVRTAYGSLGECLLKLQRERAFLARRPEFKPIAALLEQYATHLDHAGAAALRAVATAEAIR